MVGGWKFIAIIVNKILVAGSCTYTSSGLFKSVSCEVQNNCGTMCSNFLEFGLGEKLAFSSLWLQYAHQLGRPLCPCIASAAKWGSSFVWSVHVLPSLDMAHSFEVSTHTWEWTAWGLHDQFNKHRTATASTPFRICQQTSAHASTFTYGSISRFIYIYNICICMQPNTPNSDIGSPPLTYQGLLIK